MRGSEAAKIGLQGDFGFKLCSTTDRLSELGQIILKLFPHFSQEETTAQLMELFKNSNKLRLCI